MGLISVAAFRPKPGMEDELQAVIDDRLPLLRGLGLATDREEIRMRARDGVIVTVSEWASQEAIETAHRAPEVHAMWERFAACSEYVQLHTLAETHDDFACFEAL